MTKNKETQRVVTRDAFVREISDEMIENRQVEFVISSEAVDSYGTVFKMDGWKLDRYKKNGVVFYVHRSSSENPDLLVGSGEVYKDAGQLIGRVTFEPEEINPLAEKVLKKIKHGTLRMASVGADPQNWRMGLEEKGEDPNVLYFTEQELLEFSICPLGSNPDAHKRNQVTLDEMIAEVTSERTGETEQPQEFKRSVREAQLIINS